MLVTRSPQHSVALCSNLFRRRYHMMLVDSWRYHRLSSQTQHPHVSTVPLSKPQRALISTIESGQEIIISCTDQLDTKAQLPELGSDPASVRWKQVTLDSNKQTVTSQIAAMNAATAEVVTLTSCELTLAFKCNDLMWPLHLSAAGILYLQRTIYFYLKEEVDQYHILGSCCDKEL